MKDKYIWWGILGIAVAALFYWLTSKQISSQAASTSPIQVPYLVPTNGASPSAGPSLSTQPNIIGSSPNSTIPNFSNPLGVSQNPFETPNTWGSMPTLISSPASGVGNDVSQPVWATGYSFSGNTSSVSPFAIPHTPQTGNPMVIG